MSVQGEPAARNSYVKTSFQLAFPDGTAVNMSAGFALTRPAILQRVPSLQSLLPGLCT